MVYEPGTRVETRTPDLLESQGFMTTLIEGLQRNQPKNEEG